MLSEGYIDRRLVNSVGYTKPCNNDRCNINTSMIPASQTMKLIAVGLYDSPWLVATSTNVYKLECSPSFYFNPLTQECVSTCPSYFAAVDSTRKCVDCKKIGKLLLQGDCVTAPNCAS